MRSHEIPGARAQKLSTPSATPDEFARAALRLSCAAIVGVRARALTQPRLRRKALFYITRESCEVIVDVCESFIQRIGYIAARLAEHSGRSQVTILDVLQTLDDWIAPCGGDSFRVSSLVQYAAIEELLPPRDLEPFPRRRLPRNVERKTQEPRVLEAAWSADADAREDELATDDCLLDLNRLMWDKRLAGDGEERGDSQAIKFKPESANEPGSGVVKESGTVTASDASSDERSRIADATLPSKSAGDNADAQQNPEQARVHGACIERWMPPFPPLHTYMDTPVYAAPENESEVDKLRRLNEQRLQVENALARARATGYRPIENPYLQLPTVGRDVTKAIDMRPESRQQVHAAVGSRTLSAREPLESEIVTARIRPSNQEVSDKAERILAESGGVTESALPSSEYST